MTATLNALVFHPFIKERPKRGFRPAAAAGRTVDARLQEAAGLTQAINVAVVAAESIPLSHIRPSTYIGAGKLEEFRDRIAADDIDLVVFDATLSPVQQRNLERRLKTKVIDRTGLILEIFGERAQTREGVLQVELAHLNYQKSRLVRSWTHLERQRGGKGFLGGPGETQIEADRRVIRERITRISQELEKVKRTRTLHRAKRRQVPYPVVALVGYTNAGKSTLFNRLAGAKVMAKDMLFATLDPTMRAVALPSGKKMILSDTVGFISDLPTHLIAAFRATLEEVTEADLILHVRDISHPDSDAEAEDVSAVLASLGVAGTDGPPVIEVWNKIDQMDEESLGSALSRLKRLPTPGAAISALTGVGCEALLERIDECLGQTDKTVHLRMPQGQGERIAWLYRNGDVLDRRQQGEMLTLHVRLSPADLSRYQKRFNPERMLPG